MQYFYGDDWNEDIDDSDLESEEDWYNNLIISSNPARVLTYGLNFEELAATAWG